MVIPATLDEVISELDLIIKTSVQNNNYLGIFAFVYRRTTAQIKAEIEAGAFEDNERMRGMDVRFANLYIKAYHDFQSGKPASKCWTISFEAANDRLALLQHLLLGMHAHINIDLAIAASSTMEGKPVRDFANDFHKVNDVLSSITDEMQQRLARVSPLMFILDWIGQRSDEKIIDFSMKVARTQSWNFAQKLWSLEGHDKKVSIEKTDQGLVKISERIRSPRTRLLRTIIKIVRTFESRNIKHIIESMRQ